jgi:hypothetical protein
MNKQTLIDKLVIQEKNGWEDFVHPLSGRRDTIDAKASNGS